MQLRRSDVTWREIDGEMVILDLASSTYLTTNRTGAVLLKLLVDERSHDELVDALVAHFDVSGARADADVTAFADLLRKHGLLQSTETRAGTNEG